MSPIALGLINAALDNKPPTDLISEAVSRAIVIERYDGECVRFEFSDQSAIILDSVTKEWWLEDDHCRAYFRAMSELLDSDDYPDEQVLS